MDSSGAQQVSCFGFRMPGGHEVPDQGLVEGAWPKVGAQKGTISRFTTYDPSVADLRRDDRLCTLRSATDLQEQQPARSAGSHGGKIRRLSVDRGDAAGFDSPSNSQASGSDDPQHPLHNGNDDLLNVNMVESNGHLQVTKFPKLDELKHFHYTSVNLRSLKVFLNPTETESVSCFGDPTDPHVMYKIEVYCNGHWWFVFRDFDDFCSLDELCHRCIYNRLDSQLTALRSDEPVSSSASGFGGGRNPDLQLKLSQYLHHLLLLGVERINCASILEWFEIDKEGKRRHVSSRTGINVRGKAAARVIRDFKSSQPDELPLAVGTIVSIIDMPAPEVSSWWRGKKGLKVGFFPQECVELIKKGNSPPEAPPHKKGSQKASTTSMSASGHSRGSKLALRPSTSMDPLTRPDKVFGGDLGAHVYDSGRQLGSLSPLNDFGVGVPLVVRECTAFVEKHGIVEGIYRLNGINRNIHNLKNGFELALTQGCPELETEGILADQHCISSLCKLYFRELPNPLLTFELFDAFCNAVQQADANACYMALARCLARLPPPHLRTTEHLMRHLHRLARQSNVTEMHARNLSIVWAPNLLKMRADLESPINLMMIRRTAQVVEWLIERVDWFFGEDGLHAMCGEEPDTCLIPQRPVVDVSDQESGNNSPAEDDHVVQDRGMVGSMSTGNISTRSSDTSVDKHGLRRSLSDCSRLSPTASEERGGRVTVVANPKARTRRMGSFGSLRSTSGSTKRKHGKVQLFRKGKKAPVEIGLPTNIVTTVDVRLHTRIGGPPPSGGVSPLEARGLITPRETSRMLHDSGAASSPADGSGFGTLPYDETPTSSDPPFGGMVGDDTADEQKYAHISDSESSETTSFNQPTPRRQAQSVSSGGTGSLVSGSNIRPPKNSPPHAPPSQPTTPSKSPNVQRVGKEVMALGHPGTNVRYSQHILHWSFEDGEAKAYHLSGAPVDGGAGGPDAAKSLNRKRTYGSVSGMSATDDAVGSSMTLPVQRRVSSIYGRRTRAEIEAAAAGKAAAEAVQDKLRDHTDGSDAGSQGGKSSASGGSTTMPGSNSGDFLASVLAAGDTYRSSTHLAEDEQAAGAAMQTGSPADDRLRPMEMLNESSVLDKGSPLHSSTPVPTAPEEGAQRPNRYSTPSPPSGSPGQRWSASGADLTLTASSRGNTPPPHGRLSKSGGSSHHDSPTSGDDHPNLQEIPGSGPGNISTDSSSHSPTGSRATTGRSSAESSHVSSPNSSSVNTPSLAGSGKLSPALVNAEGSPPRSPSLKDGARSRSRPLSSYSCYSQTSAGSAKSSSSLPPSAYCNHSRSSLGSGNSSTSRLSTAPGDDHADRAACDADPVKPRGDQCAEQRLSASPALIDLSTPTEDPVPAMPVGSDPDPNAHSLLSPTPPLSDTATGRNVGSPHAKDTMNSGASIGSGAPNPPPPSLEASLLVDLSTPDSDGPSASGFLVDPVAAVSPPAPIDVLTPAPVEPDAATSSMMYFVSDDCRHPAVVGASAQPTAETVASPAPSLEESDL